MWTCIPLNHVKSIKSKLKSERAINIPSSAIHGPSDLWLKDFDNPLDVGEAGKISFTPK